MKNKYKKIKAFTLSEMIVVLMITIIVVGLAFAVLSLVQKQLYGMERNYERRTEVNLLRQALWVDFRTYPNIYYNAKDNTLYGENEMKGVTYIFEKNWVIREKDTFFIPLATKEFYFDGLETSSGPVDAIKLLTDKKGGSKKVFVHKKNTATIYLN